MKKLASVLALSLVSFSCNSHSKDPKPTPTPAQPSVLSTGRVLENTKSTDVAFQLYRLMAADPQNVNLSPLSLKIAFSMVYPGAVNGTHKLLGQIFGFNDEVTDPFAKEYQLASKLKGAKSSDTDLLIANSVWAKNPREILPEFSETLKIQNAEVSKIGIDNMNEWVADVTHQKIPKLFDKLAGDLQLVFVNAIYFKQKWASPFDVKNTAVSNFQSSPNLSVKVPMMVETKKARYFEDDVSKWVGLSYANSPFVMYLSVPKKRYDLRSVDEKISSEYLANVADKMKEADVALTLPKFKLNQKGSLKSVLKDAGYGELFTKGDYSGIAKSKPVLSDVIQATTIEVDESGTEAAAATAVMMRKGMAPEPLLSKSFTADQPFLFLLRNEETKEIYWIGRVYQPLELNK